MASFSNFESITNRFIMKKLFFTVAITACLAINIPINVSANELSISVFQEKKYKKIKVEEVSKEVLAKIQKSYGNYSIKEAYKADDGEYKLILTKDGVDTTVTLTSTGEIIKIY